MPEEMAEGRMVQPTHRGQVAEVSIRFPERRDAEESDPRWPEVPDPEGTDTGGTEDTTEDDERGAEDEEDTEGSRTGVDTAVAVREVEVSEASLTGGILRFRAR